MHSPLYRLHRRAHSKRGMSLIEVMISFLILTVAVLILSSTITASVAHTGSKRERALAAEAVMNMLESMRAAPFEQLYALYNSDPDDDPEGVGTAPGSYFHVANLTPLPSPEGPGEAWVGEISLPGAGPGLFENAELPELGLPRDLNGDLAIRATDVADRYQILPAIVTVRWLSGGAERKLSMPTIFSAMENAK
ncbi:MAG: type II secretory pathway pseudopilin PulG [Planctomycetota bacterium]|jgi:type II secretory pathway pseudopilin PulG